MAPTGGSCPEECRGYAGIAEGVITQEMGDYPECRLDCFDSADIKRRHRGFLVFLFPMGKRFKPEIFGEYVEDHE